MNGEKSTKDIASTVYELTKGVTLLKAGRSGKPHFRRFQLSQDLSRITWDSAKQRDAGVLISQITDIVIGQKTKVFENSPVPGYEALSFSVKYQNLSQDRSLDIICKDKKEFETWTSGIRALMNGFTDTKKVEEVGTEADKDKKPTLLFSNSYEHLKLSKLKEEACDIYTWGDGSHGMLGHGDDEEEKTPRVVESLLGRHVQMTACGTHHTMALSITGEVFSWGYGAQGRLGHGNIRDRYLPLMIRELRGMDVQMIACHEWHSAAVCDNGDLFTWGKNSSGCLGYECEKQLVPRRIKSLGERQVSVVACGQSHTTIATVDGTTHSFGANNRGQLGIGDSKARTRPTSVEVLQGVHVVAVACGAEFTSAVTDQGQLWMWGANDQGQLGTGQNVDQLFPARVESIRDYEVCDVSCGDLHAAILTSRNRNFPAIIISVSSAGNGIVYCCGLNKEGQLGQGTSSQHPDFSRPQPISIPGKITQVACGSHSTIALAENGRIFTWGRGVSGVLGHGDNKNRVIPTEVEGMSDKHVRTVSCKGSHSAVTVVCSWVPDDEAKLCMACKLKFTTVRRRHHCRKCGGLFCDACSDKRFPLLSQGYSEPVRVCDRCYTLLTNEK